MESLLGKVLKKHQNDDKLWKQPLIVKFETLKSGNNDISFLIPPTKSPNKRKVPLHNKYEEEFNFKDSSGDKYLKEKYFESLYSIKMPLYYFSKSTISRLESVYLNKNQELKKLLSENILSLNSFDKRHRSLFDHFINKVSFTEDEIELKYLEKFSKNHLDIFKNLDKKNEKLESLIKQKIENYLLLLKIRESQLQVILITEYLYLEIGDIKTSKVLVDSKEVKIVLPKRNLIRQRSVKKEQISIKPTIKNDLFFRNLLTGHFDRFLIWDIIVETKFDEIDELTFSKNFVKKIIIPYFYQKNPHLIKYMKSKVTGDLIINSKKRSKPQTKKSVKRLKTESRDINIGLEIKNSLNNEPEKTLKRVQSLNNTKLLSKREIEISNKNPKKTINQKFKEIENKSKSSILKKSKSLIENNSKIFSNSLKKSVSQIDATPIKNFPEVNVDTSYRKSLTQSFSQIDSTPNAKIVINDFSPSVIESPDNSFIKITSSTPFFTPKKNRYEEIMSPENGETSRLFSNNESVIDDSPINDNFSFLADVNGSPVNLNRKAK